MMYSVRMLRVNIYISEDLNAKLDMASHARRQVKAELVREALEAGLKTIQPKSDSAQALVNLAKSSERVPTQGKLPKDFIKNLDFYTWGGEKRE